MRVLASHAGDAGSNPAGCLAPRSDVRRVFLTPSQLYDHRYPPMCKPFINTRPHGAGGGWFSEWHARFGALKFESLGCAGWGRLSFKSRTEETATRLQEPSERRSSSCAAPCRAAASPSRRPTRHRHRRPIMVAVAQWQSAISSIAPLPHRGRRWRVTEYNHEVAGSNPAGYPAPPRPAVYFTHTSFPSQPVVHTHPRRRSRVARSAPPHDGRSSRVEHAI